MSYDSVINRGEYFSDHYLAEVLPKTLKKDLFKAWSEREAAETRRVAAAKEDPQAGEQERRRHAVTPREGLRRLRSRYFDDRPAFARFTERAEEDPWSLTGARQAEHAERLHALHRRLLEALGYEPGESSGTVEFEHGDDTVEVRLALREPTVVAVECGWAPDVDAAMDPNGAGRLLDPVRTGTTERDRIETGTKLVSWLFNRDEDLRYVLLLVGGVVVLADRAVWGEGRYLGVSLDAALSTNATDELGTIAALLGAESLLPKEDGSGDALAELVDSSHQHAVGVSKELRQGLQRSVEIIANEVLDQLRRQRVSPHDIDTGTGRSFADELARQSLRYLYRILFLLYAEARPELGVVPAKDEAYLRGYSMARLGDLVVHDLQGEEARASTHLYASLDLLFRMVNEGHNQRGRVLGEEEAAALSEGAGLRFEPLRADLFDPQHTSLIGQGLVHPDDDPDEPEMPRLDTRLRNAALHQVLRLLMLSRGGKKGRGGFISYAQLGINQLGAVYEGLMSYTGRIAEEELYEVAKNGDPKDGSWLVPHSKVDDYPDDVWVHATDEDGRATDERKRYRPGQFVYRLAGRDRETSASYYTPESLTRLTVQLTLRERLDQDGETTPARELLEWTICEPALGSGAFLNEAINQVAAEYLKRATHERGEELEPEHYAEELQKVKAYIALHRSYGVDLNETAVELAEVSLWLNVMYPGLQAPWFGLHLRRGNSLVGAGRRLYSPEAVKKGEWLKSAPLDVPFRDGEIPEGHIHHWLLPAQGWGSVASEKEAKNLAPEETAKLGAWRKAMRKQPKDSSSKRSQFKRLQGLSRRAEYLWGWVVRRLELSESEISRHVDVYGADWIEQPENPLDRDEVKARLERQGSPYWRLKTVMDAWCALWFWPVQNAGLLDGSDEIFHSQEWALKVSAGGGEALFDTVRNESQALVDLDAWLDFAEALLGAKDVTGTLFEGRVESLSELDDIEHDLPSFMGMVEPYKLPDKFPWLAESEKLANQHGFFHWELQFAHLFTNRGGFDIQVGNPPWVRPKWDEYSVLAEIDPWFKLEDKPSVEIARDRKNDLLRSSEVRSLVVREASRVEAQGKFLSNHATYSLISGTQPDLYRAFMVRAWSNMSLCGAVGLLHPDAHFHGDREARIREESYRRLRVHGDFVNPGHRFFPEPVGESTHFGLHIYRSPGEIDFKHLCWLFSVDSLSRSLDHDGSGDAPGVRYKGKLDERPHGMRVIRVTKETLEGWRELSGSGEVPVGHVKLLSPVSRSEDGAIRSLSGYRCRLGQFRPQISSGFHEKGAKERGIIDYNYSSPCAWSEVILKGVQIGLATPLFKSPRAGSNDVLGMNLVGLDSDAVPETEYRRASSLTEFLSGQDVWLDHDAYNRRIKDPEKFKQARVSLSEKRGVGKSCISDSEVRDHFWFESLGRYTDFYRLAWRRLIAPDTERCLYVSLVPPGVSHIHGVHTLALPSAMETCLAAGFWSSLPLDYFVRVSGKTDLGANSAKVLPVGYASHPLSLALLVRTLRLNCLTGSYSSLWEGLYEPEWQEEEWACAWPGLESLGGVGPNWKYATPLRDERSRRSALVEIDALVAVWIGMDVEALIAAYRARFPVLNRYEESTFFDSKGWKLAGIHRTHGQIQTKTSYKEYLGYRDEGGPVPVGYSAPFYKADREAEYREAHAYFTEIVERAKRDGTWTEPEPEREPDTDPAPVSATDPTSASSLPSGN